MPIIEVDKKMEKNLEFHLKMLGLIFGLALAFAIVFVVFFRWGYNESDTLFRNDFIQAHHYDFNYSIEGSDIAIKDVYCHNMKGSSMNPALFEGNTICFKEYKDQELRQGNIIYYSLNGEENIHRIIALQDNLIVKGDNNKFQEEINYTDVKGILAMVLYT